MNKEIKLRIHNITAKAALKFGSEAWVLKKREEQHLEVARLLKRKSGFYSKLAQNFYIYYRLETSTGIAFSSGYMKHSAQGTTQLND